MKYRKSIIILIMAIFIFGISSAFASEVNDAAMTGGDTGQMELSSDSVVDGDNAILTQAIDDEGVSAQTDLPTLSESEGNYSDLRNDIENGGNLTKSYYRYRSGDGGTIEITTPDMVINGNGAVIDMDGAWIQALKVSASGVTFKNLTIKNVNYDGGNGGAIYFNGDASSGNVENCNFTGIILDDLSMGGAIYFSSNGNVTNCNFKDNNAVSGGAIYMGSGTVTNCNFMDNCANEDGGAVYFLNQGTVENCNFNVNEADRNGGAIWMGSGSVENSNFADNSASDYGGAIFFSNSDSVPTVTNCNFTGNKINSYDSYGGAIMFRSFEGIVSNCNFNVNEATGSISQGGAVYFLDQGTVENCNFTGNNANTGSAIYFWSVSSTKTISNSLFLNNRANSDVLEVTQNENNIEISFMGKNNLINAIYSEGDVSFTNVTYWGAEGITNTGESTITLSKSNREAGQNITVTVVADSIPVLDEVMVTDENGTVVLNLADGTYDIAARHGTDSYYTQAEKTQTVNIGGLWSGLSSEIGEGGNITLKHGLYTYDYGDTIKINVSGSVIDGKGAVIDMAGSDIRAFYVEAFNVTFKNLTIKNANYTGDKGGAIYFNGSGTVINCNFTNNAASDSGGAVCFWNQGTVKNCNFTSNKAPSLKGYGGGAVCFNGYGTVTDCYFVNNSASKWCGGALYFNGEGTVTDCDFEDNFVGNDGGAVYFSSNGNVKNCNFINNSDFSLGGAIRFIQGSSGTVENCNFTDNRASGGGAVFMSDGDVTNCNFINNKATDDGWGGAICMSFGNVSNCNFINNQATDDGWGGAICMSFGNVSNCNFINNQALSGMGGAILFYEGNSSVTDCLFISNRAGNFSAVYLSNGVGNVSGCLFINNSAEFGVVGTVWDSYNQMSINNNIFLNNEVTGDVIDFKGAGVLNTDYNWFGNTADNYNGEVPSKTSSIWLFLNATANPKTILDTGSSEIVFKLYAYNNASKNVSDYNNALLKPVNLTITTNGNVDRDVANLADKIIFTPIKAETGSVTASVEDVSQRVEIRIKGDFDILQDLINSATSSVINLERNYTYSKTDAITEGVVINRTVTINGNGYVIDAKGKSRIFNVQASDVTIKNLTLINAYHDYYGGAIYFNGSGSVENCNFTNNTAYDYGGAVYFSSTGEVINCNFEDNFVDDYGGAVYFSSTGDVTNCNFEDNFVDDDGGAVYFKVNGDVTNCNFINNSARGSGGAIRFDQGSSCTVEDCNFTDNRANCDGGAVSMSDGEVINCNFINNNATDDGFGGAICMSFGNVSNCNFTNNTATRGGAIYFGDGNVTDCNFMDNNAYVGGAVYIHDGEVINCNFIDNTAAWAGAVHFSSNGEVTNCNFINNQALSGMGGAICFYEGNSSVIDCVFISNCAGNFSAVYLSNGVGNVSRCLFINNSAEFGVVGQTANSFNQMSINNNIFLNNDVTGDVIDFKGTGDLNTDYNWFGNTADNYNGEVPSKTSSIWLFLNATANPDTILDTGSSEIVFKLYAYNNASKNVLDYNNNLLKPVNLTITTNGNVDRNATNFGDKIIFTPVKTGTGSVTASVEDVSQMIEICVKGDFDILQDLINNATSPVINLDRNYTFSETDEIPEGILINRTVTINGNGYVIDAKGKSRIFNVQADDVTINNLTLINANYTGEGGAVYFNGSGNVINCNFADNNASDGGAVYFNGNGAVTDCSFKGNNATSNGGAVCGKVVTVENCNFTDNSALDNGGAVWSYSGDVAGCNFIDNKAISGSGGAVRFTENGNVTDCNFINNSAENGGAVKFNGAGDLTNCNFTANIATSGDGGAAYFMLNGTVSNCTFTNNNASGDGGAVYFADFATGTVTDCNFTGNQATSDTGGAVSFSDGTLTNCNFADNNASKGGAVFFYEGNVSNCNFTGNWATSSTGGAVSFCNGTLTDCNFADNTAIDGGAVFFYEGNVSNCNFTNNTASRDGGAIVFDGNGTVTDCNFVNNSACDGDGGAIWIYSGTLADCNFADNSAFDGGAVFFYDAGTVTDCNFTDNSAFDQGGAVYFNATGILTDSICTDNFAYDRGGAVYFNGTGELANSNFTNNTSNITGGAAYFHTDGKVSDCNFTDNEASSMGGAVSFYSNTGEVTDCIFTANNASFGGAVSFYSDTGKLSDCIFTDNLAEYGGAVYIDKNGTVTDCNFTANNATWGGAVFFNDNGEVADCSFVNNTAFEGSAGAVYFIAAGAVENSNFTGNRAAGLNAIAGAIVFEGIGNVGNCNFANNTAEGAAGAIMFYDAGKVWDCNFVNNAAFEYDGGAVYFDSTGNVSDCSFTGNSARCGGAVYFEDGFDSAIENCNFAENTASNAGGAVYSNNTGTVQNCSFTGNLAEFGGAVYFENNGTLTNSNFKGNNATAGSAVYFSGTSNTNAVSNSGFSDNRADADADTPLNVTMSENTIEISFTGQNNLINAIYSNGEVSFTNVTYWGAEGVTNTDDSYPSKSNVEAGQNIAVWGVVNGNVMNTVKTTGSDGKIVIEDAGDYWINVRHDENSYYTGAESLFTNMQFQVNVSEIKTTNRTVNLTAKSNIYNEVMPGKLAFILPGDDKINATYAASGIWWAVHTFDDYGDYNVGASYVGLNNVSVKNATVSIDKANSTVELENVVMDYGDSANVTVKAEGATGITADIDGSPVSVVNNYTIPISNLDVGNYTLTVTTIPDRDHKSVSKTASITVNKALAEIILANETVDLKVNDEAETGAALTPAGAGNLTYASSNSAVAMVEEGKIIAVGKGQAIITVSFNGNDKYAASENKTITVNVSLRDACVSVNSSTLELFVDDKATIVATTSPDGLNVTYVPDNSGVYTVDENGVVTALKEGTATVIVKVGDGKVYAQNSTEVTVSVSKIPTEITVNPASLDLFVGDETVIVANLTPAGAGNVTFTSSNDTVVSVDDQGYVLAEGKGQAVITVSFAGNDKYAAAENRTITVNVRLNDASVTVDSDTLDLKVGETHPINATKNPDTILLDITYASSDSSVASVDENGIVTAVGEGSTVITVEVGDGEIYAVNSTNVTVTVSRIATEIDANPVTATYNVNRNLIITLKDANGTPLSGKNISVDLNGAKTYTTDNDGQVKVSTKGLTPDIYTAKITFNGTANYANSAKEVKVTVKKATPKITAKAKTFMTTAKNKKYTVTLKDNRGKPIKKATVYLKVAGKTYKATTNSKGKATFNLKKLTRNGKYSATITYKGSDCYKKVTKKVKITVKAGFRTIAKGSKLTNMVKIIQLALKGNGYYLSYNGHYLMVDGIFEIYTEMAVKDFQKDHGLKVTGKVDEKTAKKLKII